MEDALSHRRLQDSAKIISYSVTSNNLKNLLKSHRVKPTTTLLPYSSSVHIGILYLYMNIFKNMSIYKSTKTRKLSALYSE